MKNEPIVNVRPKNHIPINMGTLSISIFNHWVAFPILLPASIYLVVRLVKWLVATVPQNPNLESGLFFLMAYLGLVAVGYFITESTIPPR